MLRQDIEPNIECKNIFSGEKVKVIDIQDSKVIYTRKNRHLVEGLEIREHNKPMYVFAQTYKLL